MSSSSSSSYFTTHTLKYSEAPDSPTSLLIDKRLVSYLPKPTHPPRLTPLGEDGTTCFEIRPAGTGKGLGMFATRQIPTGSLIYVEHPAIFAPAEVPLTGEARSHAYHSLSETLPQHRRDELHTMANCRSLVECALEEGILCTNALALELGLPDDIDIEAREYGGVFLIINRCNHR